MAEIINYEFQKLVEIGEHLISVADQFQSRADQLETQVHQERSSWEGEASDAFATLFVSWLEKVAQTADELRAIGNILIAVMHRYKTIESEVEGQWRRDI